MSHDLIADALNQIMNVKKSGKKELEVKRISKFLLKVLDMAKEKGYLDYTSDGKKIKITILELSQCLAVKPRFNANKETLEKYVRRYLPARNFGMLIISTNQGLMTHEEAYEKKLGGSIIAYFY
jgi:small subunit ribosomal protein S8